MKRAVILGTGGLGRLLVGFLPDTRKYELLGFSDPDSNAKGTLCAGLPVIGDDDRVAEMFAAGEIDCSFNGLGDTNLRLREKLYTRFAGLGIEFPSFMHASAIVSPQAEIGSGTLILPRAVVGPDARIGNNVILFSGAIVEHDCVVSDHAYLSPGVVLSGGVRVGTGAFLGSASTVIPGKSIGDGSVVGAGAVVTSDVPAGVTVVGIPAKQTASRSASK